MKKIYLKDVIDALQGLYNECGNLPVFTPKGDMMISKTDYVSDFRAYVMLTGDHKEDHVMILFE